MEKMWPDWAAALMIATLVFPVHAQQDTTPSTASQQQTTSSNSVSNKLNPVILENRNDIQRGYLYVGGEVANLVSEESTLQGAGFKAGFVYGLRPKIALSLSLAQIYGQSEETGSVTILYTGMSGALNYAIMGTFISEERSYLINGRRVVKRTQTKKNAWSLGVTVDQLMLNGESQTFPATGLGLQSSYEFEMFDFVFRPEVRYSMLTARGGNITGMFFMLTTHWDL